MRSLILTLILLVPTVFVVPVSQATDNVVPEDFLDIQAELGERALTGLLLDVEQAGERLVAVGEYGAIVYSDDKGKSWNQAQVPVQVTLTAVHFPSPSRGWAVGHDAVILHSKDGGETWHRQLDGRETGEKLLQSAQAWQTRLEQKIAGLGGADDEKLMMQVDGAQVAVDEAQRELEIGPNRPFLDVWFEDDKRGFAIGAFNYFFTTEDGGKNWRDASPRIPNEEFLHLYSIYPIAEKVLLMAGEFGLLLRSADGGLSWERLDIGYEGSLFSIAAGYGSAWVAGLRGNVFYSDDGGDNWQSLRLDIQASVLGSQALSRERAVFVGAGGAVIKVDQASQTVADYSKIGSTTLAAIHTAEDGAVVVTGSAGLVRVESDGSVSTVNYLGVTN